MVSVDVGRLFTDTFRGATLTSSSVSHYFMLRMCYSTMFVKSAFVISFQTVPGFLKIFFSAELAEKLEVSREDHSP